MHNHVAENTYLHCWGKPMQYVSSVCSCLRRLLLILAAGFRVDSVLRQKRRWRLLIRCVVLSEA